MIDVRPNGTAGCFPISGECYADSCFPWPINDPDLPATGLKKTCYIHDERIFDLEPDEFRSGRGVLTGRLLAEFRKFAGV
jgi:hypothetical protein